MKLNFFQLENEQKQLVGSIDDQGTVTGNIGSVLKAYTNDGMSGVEYLNALEKIFSSNPYFFAEFDTEPVQKAFGRQQTPETRQKIADAMQGNQNRQGTGMAQPPSNYSAPKVNPNPSAGSASPNTGALESKIQAGVDRRYDYAATNAAGSKNNARQLVKAKRDRQAYFMQRLQYAISNASKKEIAARWNIPDITNTTPASPMIRASEAEERLNMKKRNTMGDHDYEDAAEESLETPAEEHIEEAAEKDVTKQVKRRIEKLKSMVADLSQ